MQLNVGNYIETQQSFESNISIIDKKKNGIFFTNNTEIIDIIFNNIHFDENILSKIIFEPSCGHGIFITSFIIKLYENYPNKQVISNFIEHNIYFNDIDIDMVHITIDNIQNIFLTLFTEEFQGKFNSFNLDFTIKNTSNNLFINSETMLEKLYNIVDYIIGNPPYISLYGRRDQKKNESQRVYYLENYKQFPNTVKNGKINYIMLFIEHSLELLKDNGSFSFIIDLSFFETAFKHTRKYLLNYTQIDKIIYNINTFKNVGSGQLVIIVTKGYKQNHTINTIDYKTKKSSVFKQDNWNNPEDEYKFRIEEGCENSNKILNKIFNKKDNTLKELYPKKNLRTCVMLLNFESEFIFTRSDIDNDIDNFPYYQGSKGVQYKYSIPNYEKYFYYDKKLQDNINNDLKIELTKRGIKNKKRIGLGEIEIYNNPKVYIRQSAKEIIATYDEDKSAANNSLYVFTLRDNSIKSKLFLKFLTGFFNTKLVTFFAQKRRIIRYNQGKQPQIKVSDLYQINIPSNLDLQNKIANIVNKIYKNLINAEVLKDEIDQIIFNYYQLSNQDILFIEKAIEEFLQ